jgi:hypothetical protein
MADEAEGRVASDGPDDGVSDEPVVELSVKLVVKLSDVVAAEDTRDDCQEGANGDRDVFAARENGARGRIAGQCGQALVNHQPVFQPETRPETFGEGEPVTLAKGLCSGSGLSFGVTRVWGLGEALAESLAQTLAETLAPTRYEVWLAVFSVCNLKDLGGKKGAGFGVAKSVGVPTPGRPTPWVPFPEILSGGAASGNTCSERTNAGRKEALKGVSMKSEKQPERTLSSRKEGLSRAALELVFV